MKCGAKTRKGGKCAVPAMPNGKCYRHGGATPRGAALPQTTHGLYSKSMPTQMAARYREVMADQELLSLRREAAVVTTLVADALARLDKGETGKLWLELRDRWDELPSLGPAKKAAALNDIGRLISRGATDAEAAREVRSVILDKARVAEAERKRLEAAHAVVSLDKFMIFVGAVTEVVRQEVRDDDARARIGEAVHRLLSSGGGEVS